MTSVKKGSVVIVAAMLMSCATAKQSTGTAPGSTPGILSSSKPGAGSMTITDEMIGRQYGTMPLTKSAADPQYGYSFAAPVMVGGGFDDGIVRTCRYLNSLRGADGQPIHYDRIGTCCLGH